MVPCKLFSVAAAVITNVTLFPTTTVFAADAVPVAITLDTDTAEIPVTETPFICNAAVQVPAVDMILSSLMV